MNRLCYKDEAKLEEDVTKTWGLLFGVFLKTIGKATIPGAVVSPGQIYFSCSQAMKKKFTRSINCD